MKEIKVWKNTGHSQFPMSRSLVHHSASCDLLAKKSDFNSVTAFKVYCRSNSFPEVWSYAQGYLRYQHAQV